MSGRVWPDVARELLRALMPDFLAERMQIGDREGAIARILGDDQILDGSRVDVCACNASRYWHGHMQLCPLAAYGPEVVVVARRPRR